MHSEECIWNADLWNRLTGEHRDTFKFCVFFDDVFQVLLLDALVVEEKKSKEEKKLYNALDAQFPRGSEAPTEVHTSFCVEVLCGCGDFFLW